jgi:hypothetical protein
MQNAGVQQGRASGSMRSQATSRSRRSAVLVSAGSSREVTLLDYGAGNVRSVRNAIKKLGFTIKDVSPSGCCCALAQAALPAAVIFLFARPAGAQPLSQPRAIAPRHRRAARSCTELCAAQRAPAG